MANPPRIAIVGGGVAGLAAAHRLVGGGGCAVTVYEATGRLGGRAFTGFRDNFRFDHGAQFLRTDTPGARHLLLEELPTGDLVDIGRDVWIFDGSGKIAPGDPGQNAGPKWTYRQGLGELGRLLAANASGNIQVESPVASVDPADRGWRLGFANGRSELADAVLVAIPAPQAALLFHPDTETHDLVEALSGVRYRSIISIAFAFDHGIARPGDFYALVNTDRAHPVSWLAFEEDKPGYVPSGKSLIVAQMSDSWSRPRLNQESEQTAAEAADIVAKLLGRLPPPLWADVVRWPLALPDATLDAAGVEAVAPAGLFFAGDSYVGGRLHLAIESGLEAADRVKAYISQPGVPPYP